MKRKLLFAIVALMCSVGTWAETDYTSLMSSTWTGSTGDFQGGRERYQDGAAGNYAEGQKVMYQSFTAPASGIYEIKFYAVTSSTSGRGFDNIWGDNIAQAYAMAGENKTTVAMTVVNQTGCTLVSDANIRTLSVEAAKGETIEYGLENISTGGNWYTIKALSAKMKTVAEIFQAQYDEAFAIWENSTENVEGARATFKTYVDAMQAALTGTLAEAQAASDNLAAALVTYENSSYPIKGKGVKYDFTSKMSMEINAWTCKQGNGPAQYGFTGATETYGNTAEGEVMYQTITGLPNGEYEIHFYAVANAANGGGVEGTATTIYANDKELVVDVIKQNACTPSDYERVFTVMVKDGTIKYGITNTEAAGNWYICKNVALYMTGAPDLSDYYDAISSNVTAATALKDQPMKVTVKNALQAAIDATEGYAEITVLGTLEEMNNDLSTAIADANASIANYAVAKTILDAANASSDLVKELYSGIDVILQIQSEYDNRTLEAVSDEDKTTCASFLSAFEKWAKAKAAADEVVADHDGMKGLVDAENTNVVNATEVIAITEATTAVKTIANAYQAWKTLKANADALVAADNDNAAANNVLKGAIDAYVAQVAEATSIEEVKTAMADLKAEMETYAYDANPAEGAQFDLTFMLTNPDVTAFWDGTVGESNSANTGTWWIQPEGWYNDQDGGNFQVMANNEMSLTEVFMEYWSENPRTSGFVLYQKATLPKGTYKMTGRVGLNQPVGGTTANMTFSANETDGTKIAVGLMADQEVEFVNTVEQEVKIGLKAHKGNCYRWIGINNIKLFKLPEAAPVTLDENVAYDYTYAGAASAQLTRTISEGFNTVMLPFSLTADEVAEYLGEGQLYSFSNADLGILNFASSTDLQANTPYLFKANTANNIENVEIPGRTFVVAPADQVVAAGSDYNFVGTYAPLTAGNDVITAADFVLGADKFVIAKGGNALKAFRAFIQANEEVAPVKALTINLDGVATAIEAIDGKAIANGAIYNLAGQRVSKAQKGIFIQNGKKVIK